MYLRRSLKSGYWPWVFCYFAQPTICMPDHTHARVVYEEHVPALLLLHQFHQPRSPYTRMDTYPSTYATAMVQTYPTGASRCIYEGHWESANRQQHRCHPSWLPFHGLVKLQSQYQRVITADNDRRFYLSRLTSSLNASPAFSRSPAPQPADACR